MIAARQIKHRIKAVVKRGAKAVLVTKGVLVCVALYDTSHVVKKAENAAGSITAVSYFVFLIKDFVRAEEEML